MRFCEKLKEARTKAGLKQEELAKALGVSLRTITNYESGECYPRKMNSVKSGRRTPVTFLTSRRREKADAFTAS